MRPGNVIRIAFVALIVPAVWAQAPATGDINVYGLRKVREAQILSTLHLRPGDPLPPSKGEMEDRIALYLGTESERLRAALDAHRDYIAAETLPAEWSPQPLSGSGVHRAAAKVEGQPLAIEVKKATAKP